MDIEDRDRERRNGPRQHGSLHESFIEAAMNFQIRILQLLIDPPSTATKDSRSPPNFLYVHSDLKLKKKKKRNA